VGLSVTCTIFGELNDRLIDWMVSVDGYPMQDVVMQWKGDSMLEAVHGVELIEIPQFTLVQYRTISTVEILATGPSLFLSQFIFVRR